MKGNYNAESMMIGDNGRYQVGGDTHVRVYQRDRAKCEDEAYLRRMMDRSMGWDFAVKHGNEPKDLGDYKMMWEGDLNIHGDAETAFCVLQDRRPIETSRTMYSLSVGDVIDIDGELMFVDSYGFRNVSEIMEVA